MDKGVMMIQQPLFSEYTPQDTAAMFQALRAEFIRCSQQLSDDLYHERLTTAAYCAARRELEDWYGREGVRIDRLYEAAVGVSGNMGYSGDHTRKNADVL